MKLLLTGDLHLGRNYQKEDPDVAGIYQEARMDAFKKAVAVANMEKCQAIVIAGDLFDRISGISVGLMKQVASVLDGFEGESVLILPGNHDYYDPDTDQFWEKFEEYTGSNVKVLKKEERVIIGDTAFYPCPCWDKHSKKNGLAWIKECTDREPGMKHVGIAHGAIEGLSFDSEKEYYFMTRKELQECRMDAWLIGHTHVNTPCYKGYMGLEQTYESIPEIEGCLMQDTVFNAGTHQQTDIADNSLGIVFILDLKEDGVYAHSVQTSVIQFIREEVTVTIGDTLEQKLEFPYQKEKTTLRLKVKGTASETEYENRRKLYQKLQDEYIKVEIDDSGLRKEITQEMIDMETPDGSTLNLLLKSYVNEPELLNLLYDTIQECR